MNNDRNAILITHDGNVWRATLGDGDVEHTATSTSPWTAIILTINKAQEAGWEFDRANSPPESED